MQICFDNGKTYISSATTDYMLKSFFSEIASRPICYKCPFKHLERCSDITLYDCWHFTKLTGIKADDDKGYTNVIVQSLKGKKLLDDIADGIVVYPVDTENAIQLDGVMVRNNAKPHKYRKVFYTQLNKENLPEQIAKYIPISAKDRLKEIVKKNLYRIGILQIIRNRKR